ncbi:uncharacterized protein LOC127260778 isoform X2 [Andrographis paniculata]|uniref:uncharacterized protein LOC127260778 isoform X2 n=1 Tax=Andrographis paniculata TaxID=175694 RepID=UPI0021E919EB|nr:uncharacterized protein LOC127260778 isoform X2 [Andrographis paniculata]
MATSLLLSPTAAGKLQEINQAPPAAATLRTAKDAGVLRKSRNKERSNWRIAAFVVEDPAGVAVKNAKAVERKLRRNTISRGFSFSAAALLFPYHTGVAQFLIEKDYINERVPLAGSSAGAITSAAIASGISMEEGLRAAKKLAEDCRLHGTLFRLAAVLRDTLHRILPNDAHIRCSGRVRVAITQIHNFIPNALLVDQFESKEDLINALLASSFIPGYLSPMPATVFRNHLCIDGIFTHFIPPTSAPQTIGVSAIPGLMGLQDIRFISPDCNPPHRANLFQYLNWACWPAEEGVLERLFECGYLDAKVWDHQITSSTLLHS